ncbi:MAG: hypothetical protein OEX12_05915 [Gammaproteobacteria bacterium]|nr:hypothetical protein [Gammaproteobacteria bacterium]
MRIIYSRTLAAAIVSTILAGCENRIVIDTVITVPVFVQEYYSTAAPGRLIVQIDVPKSGLTNYSLAVLCNPGSSDITATMHHDDFGCAKAGMVRAWIKPIPAEKLPVTCEISSFQFFESVGLADGLPQATTSVFAENTGDSGCSSGSTQVNLTIMP